MLGIEPVPRERALGLIQEWTEVLTGRPDPTTQLRASPLSTLSGPCGLWKADSMLGCTSLADRVPQLAN